MKTILKIILVSLFLSPTISKAQSDNPLLDFEVLGKATIEEVQALINQGYDVNEIGPHKSIILHKIIYRGRIDIVALLIESGADIHARDIGGGNPLHEAAYGNHPEILQLLIDAGADIDAKTDYGATPLYYATRTKSIDVMRILLQLGADPNIPKTYDGSTAFMNAVERASYPDEDYYTAEDAARDKAKGITPRTILELLVEYGADPHAVDNKGNNACTYIYSRGGINANIVRGYLDELGVK